MTDAEKQQGQQLAVQIAIEQRNQALNQVIDLTATLTMAQAKIAQLEAAKEPKEE